MPTILTPDNGCFLTQANPDIPADCRIIATSITLASTDSADNYIQISAEEAQRIEEERERILANRLKGFEMPCG